MQLIAVLFTAALVANAGDRGLVPRAPISDYPARHSTSTATLAADIVPAREIQRLFTSDIARHYIVLEVAIYPNAPNRADIDWSNFSAKIGATTVSPVKPADVVLPWSEKNKLPGRSSPVTVITSTEVVLERYPDVNGKPRTRVSTIEDVGVTNDPAAAPPPPQPRQDPEVVERRIDEYILPKGTTAGPIAGYLFFPLRNIKLRKGTVVELHWSQPHESATVRLEQK